MEYLTLGVIVGSFSLDGTIRVFSTTDQANVRYEKGKKVFLISPEKEETKEMTVKSYKASGRFDLVKLQEVNTAEEADSFKKWSIEVEKKTSDLKEGYFYFADLIGCTIFNEQGEALGVVKEVEEFPAQITLRVKRHQKADFFVPFIDQFILNVDIAKKSIKIHQVEGML